jgi:hypothetical protein
MSRDGREALATSLTAARAALSPGVTEELALPGAFPFALSSEARPSDAKGGSERTMSVAPSSAATSSAMSIGSTMDMWDGCGWYVFVRGERQWEGRDETRRDETRRDETRRDETRRDETRRDVRRSG